MKAVLLGTEIRHLAALVAVARERSFSAAARRLGVAVSTLTHQLSEFEQAAGARLVERTRGGDDPARLTKAGDLLLFHAEAVMAQVYAARADLEAVGRTQLRVGMFEAVAARVMPTILGLHDDPTVRSSLASDGVDLMDGLERGTIDLCFTVLPLPAGPFDFVNLIDEPYVLVVPADCALARSSGPPTGRDVATLPFIGRAFSEEARQVERALESAGWNVRPVQRGQSDAAVRALVAAGEGAAVLPWLSSDADDPATANLNLRHVLPTRTVALAWHRHRRLPAAAERFRAAARSACATLGRLTP
jgi:molybdate transport repressor ModE-like protein